MLEGDELCVLCECSVLLYAWWNLDRLFYFNMFRVRVCMLFEANRLLFSSREETGNVVSYGSICMAIGKGLQPYVPSFVVSGLESD